MNIVILAGGTGSIALQTGLYQTLESVTGNDVSIKILTNAYDNGKSTGDVRRVMNGNILGPSDVRKNQTTRLKLEQPRSPWHDFLDIRFSKSANEVEDFCKEQITSLKKNLERENVSTDLRPLELAVQAYFNSAIASRIDYNDFSLANIIYAGLAKLNNNSLRGAAREMSILLGIQDNVILNDDTSLFLGAITESGIRVTDEGDIVSWGKMDDPFVDIFFTDSRGNESKPVLCSEAQMAIVDADLIILSSGTQWSSLIPTYASSGFKSAIEQSQAKIIMVMNRVPDKDSPGQTSSDIIDLLVPTYFPERRLHVLCDITAHDLMKGIRISDSTTANSVAGVHNYDLSMHDGKTTHNHWRLAQAISNIYWNLDVDDVKNTTFVFDYDDTLVGRGHAHDRASQYNVQGLNVLNELIDVAVCTGNSIKAVKLSRKDDIVDGSFMPMRFLKPSLRVFADGGINEYSLSTDYEANDEGASYLSLRHLDSSKVLGRAELSLVMSRLKEAGIPVAKIENRGDTIIAVKPIDPEYREPITRLLELYFLDQGLRKNSWAITPSGRTTIEISKTGISKVAAVNHLLNEQPGRKVVFIGDEIDYGNDYCVKELAQSTKKLTCLKVSSPAHTAWLIRTLLDNLGVIILNK